MKVIDIHNKLRQLQRWGSVYVPEFTYGGLRIDAAISGTAVKVAQDLGRVGVGLELSADYLVMAQRRTAQMGFGTLLKEECRRHE